MDKFIISSVLRLLEILFAIICFGVLADNGKYDVGGTTYYVYNDKKSAWSYGVGVGVLMFLSALFLLLAEVAVKKSAGCSDSMTKLTYLSGLGLGALMTLLAFVGFCFLTDEWRKTDHKSDLPSKYKNAAQSAIAFYFFSILAWAASTFFSFTQFREYTNGDGGDKGSYESYGGGASEPSTGYAAFEPTTAP